MKTLRQSIRLLTRNLRSIAGFEIAYRLICVAIFLPLVTAAFQLSLWLTGYSYLSEDRIISYLLAPTTLLILVLILLFLSFITVFEVFCIIPAFHASYHDRSISLTSMFVHGLGTIRKSLKKPNRLIFLFTLVLVPLTNITIISGYVSSITIPDFILYYIRSNTLAFRSICVLFVLALLPAIRMCLSLHCYCLEPGNYKQAGKHSLALTKHCYLKTILYLFFWNIVILAGLLLLALLCFGIGVLILRLFFAGDFNSSNVIFLSSSILTILFDVYVLCAVPFTFAYLSSLYYHQMLLRQESIPAYHPESKSLVKRLSKRMLLFIVLLAAVFNIAYLGVADEINVFWNQNIIAAPTITAHRGDSKNAPENTIPSFQSAIDNHADCIELDVQQTKDHVLVVLHDTNMKRLTGQNVNVYELTYEELMQMDIGSHFSGDFSDVRVCTLEEALAYCKDQIDLNIELKTTSHDRNLEKEVASLIEEYDYSKHCIVAAKNLASLREIKQLNEEIQTIYLLPVAYGNYTEMTYIDGFSIKSSFITRKLVNHVHDSGKVIYAWTVNNTEDMERMYSLGVDSLVTDYPARAREVYYSQNLNPAITIWIRQIVDLFRR